MNAGGVTLRDGGHLTNARVDGEVVVRGANVVVRDVEVRPRTAASRVAHLEAAELRRQRRVWRLSVPSEARIRVRMSLRDSRGRRVFVAWYCDGTCPWPVPGTFPTWDDAVRAAVAFAQAFEGRWPA